MGGGKCVGFLRTSPLVCAVGLVCVRLEATHGFVDCPQAKNLNFPNFRESAKKVRENTKTMVPGAVLWTYYSSISSSADTKKAQ